MSYCTRTYQPERISKMCFIEGNGRTANTVKSAAGCDDIFNASFYGTYKKETGSGTYQKPVFHLRNDGKTLADPGWKCYGIIWDNPKAPSHVKLHVGLVADDTHDYYISGYELLTPAKDMSAPIDSNIPSCYVKRGRTLVGVKADGTIVVHVCGDGTVDALTAKQCRQKMYDLGCQYAIMLDGGGSSQCNFAALDPDDKQNTSSGNLIIKSTRAVYNYVCMWMYEVDEAPEIITKTYYRVQVGAFTVKANAERLKETLKTQGYPDAYIQVVNIGDKTYHRVQIGSFSVYANAVNLLTKVKAQGYSAFIQSVEIVQK